MTTAEEEKLDLILTKLEALETKLAAIQRRQTPIQAGDVLVDAHYPEFPVRVLVGTIRADGSIWGTHERSRQAMVYGPDSVSKAIAGVDGYSIERKT